jgi:hypothetical protein
MKRQMFAMVNNHRYTKDDSIEFEDTPKFKDVPNGSLVEIDLPNCGGLDAFILAFPTYPIAILYKGKMVVCTKAELDSFWIV